MHDASRTLASFPAKLHCDDIPYAIVGRAADLLRDWAASALAETSFKWHAACRHTRPAAVARLQAMSRAGLEAKALRLASFGGAADGAEVAALCTRVRALTGTRRVGTLLP